jgi:ADP-ribosyl-[dinitrogen reductase] hydrolase
MDRYPHILGCLLGTALGDALGLRREGMTRRRAAKLYGGPPLTPSLIFGRGFCSDDTEYTLMVGRSLVLSEGDPEKFERKLAGDDSQKLDLCGSRRWHRVSQSASTLLTYCDVI